MMSRFFARRIIIFYDVKDFKNFFAKNRSFFAVSVQKKI